MSVEHLHAVPHLTTALTGPLRHIESHLLTHQAKIESWFRKQWLQTPAPFYTSVDLRNAGFKLAPAAFVGSASPSGMANGASGAI